MSRDAIGLDIGGANLKAATASGAARSVPFELWRYPDRLAGELARVRDRWPDIEIVAVTMTGELCDCFQTKRDGVRHILAAVAAAFPGRAIRVWSTAGRFVSIDEANQHHLAIAAANWHAQATYVGRGVPIGRALLLDTGSTTTDIIPMRNGMPVPAGTTDEARLRSRELVYTGVRRTPVCAVLGPEVAAEWFATTSDVYVRLGLLPDEPENHSTADGRPMTPEYAHARLSRMVGGDPEVSRPDETTDLARRVFDAQRAMIATGIRAVLERMAVLPDAVTLSGTGEFLARAAWDEAVAGQPAGAVRIDSLSSRLGPLLSSAACAYAVAVLASEVLRWD
jgi:(4-(4-[2-(gamma-L-glutamylamino)ethyl]phenoxymethyl)furan-2-yl)methanamine synthase